MNSATNPSPGFQRSPSRNISIKPFAGTVTAKHADAIIAFTDEAFVLREENYPEVFYIPFEDIYFEFLKRTDASTHCPYKGDASYWSASASGEGEENVMWAYERPYDEMVRIKDYGAFYPDKVTIEAIPTD